MAAPRPPLYRRTGTVPTRNQGAARPAWLPKTSASRCPDYSGPTWRKEQPLGRFRVEDGLQDRRHCYALGTTRQLLRNKASIRVLTKHARASSGVSTNGSWSL